MAYADDEFTEAERVHLEGAIRRQFGLDEEQAAELIELAEEQRTEAVDLWTFTNLVAEHYSLGQKMVLAEAMWGLVYSDGELASREDYLMRKISGLLRLEPGYLAEARKRVEEHQPLTQEGASGSRIDHIQRTGNPRSMRDLVPGGYVFTHAVFWTVVGMVAVGTNAVAIILMVGLGMMVLETFQRA